MTTIFILSWDPYPTPDPEDKPRNYHWVDPNPNPNPDPDPGSSPHRYYGVTRVVQGTQTNRLICLGYDVPMFDSSFVNEKSAHLCAPICCPVCDRRQACVPFRYWSVSWLPLLVYGPVSLLVCGCARSTALHVGDFYSVRGVALRIVTHGDRDAVKNVCRALVAGCISLDGCQWPRLAATSQLACYRASQ